MPWKEVSSGPASFGYYRGTPLYRGSGSGGGQQVSGKGQFAPGQGPVKPLNGAWDPTIMFLFVLIIAEMVVFGIIAKHI